MNFVVDGRSYHTYEDRIVLRLRSRSLHSLKYLTYSMAYSPPVSAKTNHGGTKGKGFLNCITKGDDAS